MATPESWMHDEDELTEEDLDFLRQFENVVNEETPTDIDEVQEGAHTDEDDEEGEGEGEFGVEDVEIESDGEPSESGESDEVDESTMDISEVETEQPESSGSNSETEDQEDGKQVEGEGDTETDEAEFEDDIEQGAPDEAAASEQDEDEGEPEDEDYDPDLDYEEPEVEPEDSDSAGSDSPTPMPTPDAQAEDESDEMDAQQELEDHLEDEQETPEQPESEQEPSEDNGKGSPQENPEGDFSDIPEASERCTNHCEDNPEEETEHEQCPHCMERIKQERELWGAVAKDMHGQELFPGDKVAVRVPVSFIMHDSVVTVNVPNQNVDPRRVAQKTSGDVDETALWLSGRQISQFTGWRMEDARNPVWTFERGDEISFVERLDHRPPTDDEIEDAIEEFKQEMDELPETPSDDPDSETEEVEDEVEDVEDDSDSSTPDDDEDESEEDEDEDEEKDEKDESGLTKAQRERFENLTERFIKKITMTFGSTVEEIEIGDLQYQKSSIVRTIKIQSRGVNYGFAFAARRKDL